MATKAAAACAEERRMLKRRFLPLLVCLHIIFFLGTIGAAARARPRESDRAAGEFEAERRVLPPAVAG